MAGGDCLACIALFGGPLNVLVHPWPEQGLPVPGLHASLPVRQLGGQELVGVEVAVASDAVSDHSLAALTAPCAL